MQQNICVSEGSCIVRKQVKSFMFHTFIEQSNEELAIRSLLTDQSNPTRS